MTLPPLLRLTRPSHWTKNLTAFAGVIFGNRLGEPWAIGLDFAVFLVLILASSAVYIANDLVDIDRDRQHPTKKRRPLASGEVQPTTATTLAWALAVAAIAGSWLLGAAVWVCVLLYLAINVAYSRWLKHIVLADVLCIAIGFALRILAGIYVLGDLPTAWIILCGFFLALFLGYGKRLAEIKNNAADSGARPVLERYDRNFLESLVDGSALASILSYALFTATSGKNPSLIVTVPLVYIAITYYRRLLETSTEGSEPEGILLGNRVIQGCIALWLLTFILISYGDLHFFR